MSAKRRVLLIGLDAADKDLLLEAMDAGELPVLAGLRDAGAWGVVESLTGFGSGAVWPSFSTGVTPARHGRYFYRQVGPGAYEASRFEATAFKAKSFWEELSVAGRHVAVFDVPKMGLSEQLDGIEVVDWLVHGPVYHELRTQPSGFAADLAERFGLDPLPQCDLPGGRDAAGHASLLDTLCARVATKAAATRHYLAREPWDLFVTVFGDPHCVGHQSWHVRDPKHPQHDADAHAQLGDPVVRLYQAIDRAIGEIVEGVDDDTLVIVLSCTGMGANYSGNPILDEVLRRLEGKRKAPAYDLWTRTKLRLKRFLPVQLRRRGRQLSRRVDERLAGTDREDRRCFVVPHNDMAGAIRVNRIGREPGGRVHEDEMDSLYASLRRDLLELRNLDTGRPVVQDLVRTTDLCKGAHLDDLPDFFVLWQRDAPIDRVASPKIGEIRFPHRGNRTGDHRPDSVFFAKGPGVEAGHVEGVSILDFASTVGQLLGVPLPDTDGVPIARLCGGKDEDRSPA